MLLNEHASFSEFNKDMLKENHQRHIGASPPHCLLVVCFGYMENVPASIYTMCEARSRLILVACCHHQGRQ